MPGKKIKVCHLITSFWTGHGPSSGILVQLQNHDSREFAFSICSLYAPSQARDPRDLLKTAGIDYQVLPMGPSFLDIRVLKPLVLYLRRIQPDILHCHLVRANLYGPIAARLAGIKAVVCSIRGIDEYVTGCDPISRAVRLAERGTAAWVSRYVAVSETARRAIIKHLRLSPGKITTILNAVDLSPFQRPPCNRAALRAELGLAPEALVVGSVGNLLPLKNYASLVRWCAEIAPHFPGLQLLISGEGQERQALESLIGALQLTGKVRLLGFRTDIPAVLGLMDIFAFPSLSEGLPRAVMEAMAAGLPCVVMDVGGNAEAVVDGETGFVVPLGDGEQFKRALSRLLQNAALRKKMGAAGKKRAFALFNPKRLAAQYTDLYRSLLPPDPRL